MYYTNSIKKTPWLEKPGSKFVNNEQKKSNSIEDGGGARYGWGTSSNAVTVYYTKHVLKIKKNLLVKSAGFHFFYCVFVFVFTSMQIQSLHVRLLAVLALRENLQRAQQLPEYLQLVLRNCERC